jgi:hypothetical protein
MRSAVQPLATASFFMAKTLRKGLEHYSISLRVRVVSLRLGAGARMKPDKDQSSFDQLVDKLIDQAMTSARDRLNEHEPANDSRRSPATSTEVTSLAVRLKAIGGDRGVT